MNKVLFQKLGVSLMFGAALSLATASESMAGNGCSTCLGKVEACCTATVADIEADYKKLSAALANFVSNPSISLAEDATNNNDWTLTGSIGLNFPIALPIQYTWPINNPKNSSQSIGNFSITEGTTVNGVKQNNLALKLDLSALVPSASGITPATGANAKLPNGSALPLTLDSNGNVLDSTAQVYAFSIPGNTNIIPTIYLVVGKSTLNVAFSAIIPALSTIGAALSTGMNDIDGQTSFSIPNIGAFLLGWDFFASTTANHTGIAVALSAEALVKDLPAPIQTAFGLEPAQAAATAATATATAATAATTAATTAASVNSAAAAAASTTAVSATGK
jgi:hypothetical protein